MSDFFNMFLITISIFITVFIVVITDVMIVGVLIAPRVSDEKKETSQYQLILLSIRMMLYWPCLFLPFILYAWFTHH